MVICELQSWFYPACKDNTLALDELVCRGWRRRDEQITHLPFPPWFLIKAFTFLAQIPLYTIAEDVFPIILSPTRLRNL